VGAITNNYSIFLKFIIVVDFLDTFDHSFYSNILNYIGHGSILFSDKRNYKSMIIFIFSINITKKSNSNSKTESTTNQTISTSLFGGLLNCLAGRA
jgi:hypothetical protein